MLVLILIYNSIIGNITYLISVKNNKGLDAMYEFISTGIRQEEIVLAQYFLTGLKTN